MKQLILPLIIAVLVNRGLSTDKPYSNYVQEHNTEIVLSIPLLDKSFTSPRFIGDAYISPILSKLPFIDFEVKNKTTSLEGRLIPADKPVLTDEESLPYSIALSMAYLDRPVILEDQEEIFITSFKFTDKKSTLKYIEQTYRPLLRETKNPIYSIVELEDTSTGITHYGVCYNKTGDTLSIYDPLTPNRMISIKSSGTRTDNGLVVTRFLEVKPS